MSLSTPQPLPPGGLVEVPGCYNGILGSGAQAVAVKTNWNISSPRAGDTFRVRAFAAVGGGLLKDLSYTTKAAADGLGGVEQLFIDTLVDWGLQGSFTLRFEHTAGGLATGFVVVQRIPQ